MSWASAASTAAKPAGRATCCGVSATVRVTRMGSPTFSPVAVRTAALMLIMAVLTTIPARIGARRPVTEILQSGAA